jgi:hypothetical protein
MCHRLNNARTSSSEILPSATAALLFTLLPNFARNLLKRFNSVVDDDDDDDDADPAMSFVKLGVTICLCAVVKAGLDGTNACVVLLRRIAVRKSERETLMVVCIELSS